MSLKTAENGNFWAQMESFDWFLNPNAMLKISRGFNFASQQSHTFSRVLIPRKLIRLKYVSLENNTRKRLLQTKCHIEKQVKIQVE